MTDCINRFDDCPQARSHIVDSRFYGKGYCTGEARQVFCDKYRYQRWLDIEVVLAETQAGMGMIPREAADEIKRNARLKFLGLQSIQEGIKKSSHSLMPLLWALQKVCKNDAGEYIHFGATTQDIQDTAQVLEVRDILDILERDLDRVAGQLIRLADKYKNLLTVGRTHSQAGLPITFGLKFAVWADELYRSRERIEDIRKRVLVAELFGAVGSMGAFGERGLELLDRFSEKLDLAAPLIAWHASRDRFAELLSLFGIITGTLANITDEIRSLARSDIGELEEPFQMGKVGSSTMPHKRNPELCEQVVVLSRLVKGYAALGLEGMINEHERDFRTVRMEWVSLTDSSLFTCGAVSLTEQILDGLIVHVDKIARSVERAGGFICSEPLMFVLGKRIGKQTAHHLLYEISQEAFEKDIPLKELLLRHPLISEKLAEREILEALNPALHVGLSPQLVDRVVREVSAKLPEPSERILRVCPLMNEKGGCSVPQII
ncbi:MAG: adenylosuccinate lyase family protein [bacterium]